MSSSEEYLENLLQSMMNGEAPNTSETETGKQKSAIELLSGEESVHTDAEPNANQAMSPEEIEAMFASVGNEPDSEMPKETDPVADESIDDLTAILDMADLALEENSMDEMPDTDEIGGADGISDMDGISDIDEMADLDDILAAADISFNNSLDGVVDEIGMEESSDAINIDDFGMSELASEESGIDDNGMDDLAALLGMTDMALEENDMEEMPVMSEMDETGTKENNMEESGIDDLAELLGMGDMALEEGGMDADMADINGLLEQSGQEDVDDEMMALLQSVSDSSGTDFSETQEDSMNFFNGDEATVANENFEVTEEASEKKNKKEKKKKEKKERKTKKERKFGKKNKEEQVAESAGSGVMDDLGLLDGVEGLAGLEVLADMDDASESGKNAEKTGKKKGFFAKFIDFLMEEDEEEEASGAEKNLDPMDELLLGETSNENKELLDELSEEDKNKKKKKDKKDKKGKKAKKGKKGQDAQGDEMNEEEAEEESAKPKKQKRPKKEKKKKETEEKLDEKPSKKLSKKKVISVILFCATIAAGIILLSSVIPSYLQKRDAHVAYDLGNYQEAYNLLCDKELSEEDEVILHKSRIILKMERKLEAYENYQRMSDKELESLDALLQGVALYYELLPSADEYYVVGEINEVYQEILAVLSEKYGLSEVDAVEIALCDNNVTYTEYLHFIVYGTMYEDAASEEVDEETSEGENDILPEEQEIIDGMSGEEEITW